MFPSAKNRYFILAACLLAMTAVALADVNEHTEHPDELAEDDCWRIGPWHVASGYVDLSFTVTQEGTVRDPSVVETVLCGIANENPSPDKLRAEFEKAAIKAVLKFRYKPRIVDGDAVDVPGVTTRITFKQEPEAEEGAEEPTD